MPIWRSRPTRKPKLPLQTEIARPLDRECLSFLRHDHLGRVPLHRAAELVRGPLDDGKRAVMTWNRGLKLEEAFDRERRSGRAHGETIADRDHGDGRLMDLRNQTHVGENVGVAEMIDRRLAR